MILNSIKDFSDFRCSYFTQHLEVIFKDCDYINLLIDEDETIPIIQLKKDKFLFVKWNCEEINNCGVCYFRYNTTDKDIIDEILATCVIKDTL